MISTETAEVISKPVHGTMQITKWTYTGPDMDGDYSFNENQAVLDNDSDDVIELVKTSCFILDDAGTCLGGTCDNEEEVYIESRESGNLSFGGWMNLRGLNLANDAELTGLVDCVAYKRAFKKLGQFSPPDSHKEHTCLAETTASFAGLVDIHGVVCTRDKPDEDSGDVGLNIRVGVRNKSEEYIDRVEIKAVLLDQEDSEIDTTSSYEPMAPNTSRIFEPGFWGCKAGKLRNATIKVSISIYIPVADYTASAVATREE